jgi:hypothetical protein
MTITVCNRAEEVCPTYHSMDTKLHGGFPDLVTFHDSEEEKREMFQRVRCWKIEELKQIVNRIVGS